MRLFVPSNKLDCRTKPFIFYYIILLKGKGTAMKNYYHFLTLAFALLALIMVDGCKNKDQNSKKTPGNGLTTTAASSQPCEQGMIIEPNTGMGSIKFGMTMKELKEAIGSPERKLGGAFEYPSKGFAVLAGKDGKVASIMCGDMSGKSSPLVDACVCRTSKGIGMNSSEKQITAAYGPAPSVQQGKDRKILAYPSLNAMFTLKDDKVIHMIFNRAK
jgi:hypothetical protein